MRESAEGKVAYPDIVGACTVAWRVESYPLSDPTGVF
jgi:hypothetical protein